MKTSNRMRSGRALACALGLAALGACTDDFATADEPEEEIEQIGQSLTLPEREGNCRRDPRVVAGLVPLDVCSGADLFFRETFDGNGRTCASCHRVERNFAIDPEFIRTLPARDPLFVAEFNPALANLERPAQMRRAGLILENVDGTEPGGPNVRFVLRSVPHNLSMGTSIATPAGQPVPPNERTGWSGDGAPGLGRLADFTNGAINQHFTRSLARRPGIDFRVATEAEGQRVALFMIELGRKNDIDLTTLTFTDPGAETGRQRFLVVGCNGCHRNAGANTGAANTNRNFNTGVESARHTALASFPRDGGFGAAPANADGSFGDQTFNSTPLIEAADTGPFFHTDTTISGAPAHNAASANTIEQATAFFATPAFANSPSGGGATLAIDATDINNIGRFLRAVNAILNIQMAIKRANGARALGTASGNQSINVQQRLIVLALVELDDALEVMRGAQGSGQLNPAEITRLQSARQTLITASRNRDLGSRQNQLTSALSALDLADTGISAGVTFDIGSGTLMD